MSEIEKKAAAMMDALYSELVWPDVQRYPARRVFPPFEALCRAIEQLEAFRQEVSDALREWGVVEDGMEMSRFIITKPDPLVEAMQEWWDADGYADIETFRAAIEKRGGKIVWED